THGASSVVAWVECMGCRIPWPWRPRTGARPDGALQPERTQHSAGLGAGFVQLARRVGVGDDAGAGAEAQPRSLDFGAADEDVQVEVSVAVQPAHGAGVGAAANAFEFG